MPINDSDQPVHPRSLIKVFECRSFDSQGFNVSLDGEIRLCSDCVDAQIDLSICFSQYAHANLHIMLHNISITLSMKG